MAADLTPVYYIAAIGSVLGGGFAYLRKWVGTSNQKAFDAGSKQADLGAQQAKLAEHLDISAKATERNTDSVNKLTTEMRDFAGETRHRLDLHDMRITNLENGSPAPRHKAPGERGA